MSDSPYTFGDLIAQDPDTGEVRTLVDVEAFPTDVLIGGAAWSPDGRWVAFYFLGCGSGRSDYANPSGLWVANGLGERGQTTRPCFEDRTKNSFPELWQSPTEAQFLAALRSAAGDALVVIDPATGS